MSNPYRHAGPGHRQRLSHLKLSIILALLPMPALAAGDLLDLGTLGGSNSYAWGISADGSVVVGDATNSDGDTRAFRWTQSGGMLELGTINGGGSSTATGISANGSVVVGYAEDGNSEGEDVAFRWTQAGGMESLGLLLGSSWSAAFAVSADGNVVVGASSGDAFRWTEADGMVGLGALNGGFGSYAYAVSADGSVVVGYANDGADSFLERAFRWTQADGMVSLGALNNGDYSKATGVSADGSVVVGTASDGQNAYNDRAFRWTQAGGMVSLGTLNGSNTSSIAAGISADGNVVVGRANDGSANDAFRAFRWTQAGGMQSVEQWLAANGVTVGVGMTTQTANAINADGSVVVGALTNGHAFLARVSAVGSGMIDTVDFNRTLAASSFTPVQAHAQSDIVMHGLHGSPMRGLPGRGQVTAWVSGDWGRQDHGASNGDVGSGELGAAYGIGDNTTLKLAVGHTYSQQDTLYNGSSTVRGTYVLPELIVGIPDTALKFSASGYYNQGEADIQRGYLNAGTPVISSGSPDVRSAALRLRLDWIDAFTHGNLGLTPYASLTKSRSSVDGYTETGGGFPVRWDRREEQTTQSRLGMDGVYTLNERVKLLGRLEAVHNLEVQSSRASGNIIGLGNFELDGMDTRRDWVRAGVGIEAQAGPGVVSLMLNGTTENTGPSTWGYASYRVTF